MEILQWRAAHQPERTGYIFVPDGRSEETRLSYGQLDRTARRIAAELLTVASPGDRALLFFPTGPDFLCAFLGCLYAGVISIPLFPPRANSKVTRLKSVIDDSGARLALLQQSKLGEIREFLGDSMGTSGTSFMATDGIADMASRDWQGELPDPDGVAYLQYTSGSTSAPKGVMVTHGSLIYNCSYMTECFGLSSDSVSVTWLPHFHDMGLIEGLLDPLFSGFPVVVISPSQFAQRPLIWLDAISRYRATHTTAPNFGYDLCVRKIKPEQRDELDLSTWEVACSGAEPVRSETLDRFVEYFAPCGFRRETFLPAYGLAEATLMVTGGAKGVLPIVLKVDGPAMEQSRVVQAEPGEPRARPIVGCGHAWRDLKLAIVDPSSMERCPSDGTGEIWVGGPTLAAGYWQRPDDTKETFQAYTPSGEGPFMRTGDLGFLRHGELFITGRLKDLIIIRGGNFYPQDIEWMSEKVHPALRLGRAAAFSVEDGNQERLLIAQEVERAYRHSSSEDLEMIAAMMRQAVTEEFEIEVDTVLLIQPGGVPVTSSGKVQRQACRQGFLDGTLDILWVSRLVPRTERERSAVRLSLNRRELISLRPADLRRKLITLLRRQVASVIGAAESEVLPDTPLGSLGIDSLKAGELTAELEQALEIELPSTLVWNFPTIAQMAEYIAQQIHASSRLPAEAS
ncbi:MAG: AMP-binding protein [Actinomycetota bacterium]